MNKSESIKEIAKALCEVGKELKSIDKNSTAKIVTSKGTYSYSYADLPHILEIAKPLMSKHGLSIVQGGDTMTESGGAVIETLLLHVSGEWIESKLELPALKGGKLDVQTVGAAITFGRRYGGSAMLNIATEEDNDASRLGAGDNKKPQQKPQQKQEYLDFSAIQKEVDGMTRDDAVICYKGYKNRKNLTVKQKEAIEKIFTDKFGEKK